MQIKSWMIRSLMLIAAILATIAATGVAAAQTTVQLERLEVDLWPELDRPDMLVIYRGTLKPDAPLPATLELRLPSGVEKPHAVAYNDGSGNLFDAAFSTTTTEDGLVITLEAPTPSFQLEFYDELMRDGTQRSYTFVWPGDYAVDQLSVALLPPSGAAQIQTEPTLSPVQQSAGNTIYVGQLGSLAENQASQVKVSYSGGSAGVDLAPALPADGNGASSNTPLILGVAVAATALVIGGGVWYTRRSRPQPEKLAPSRQRPKKGKRRSAGKAPAQNTPSPAGHCTQCGRSLRPNDRFCGQCGTPVKGKKEPAE